VWRQSSEMKRTREQSCISFQSRTRPKKRLSQMPELTLSNRLTTVSEGCAPLANHHLILSEFQTIFFSGLTPSTGPLANNALMLIEDRSGLNTDASRAGRRGIGSYSPSFSMGSASLRLRPLMATCKRRKRMEMRSAKQVRGLGASSSDVRCGSTVCFSDHVVRVLFVPSFCQVENRKIVPGISRESCKVYTVSVMTAITINMVENTLNNRICSGKSPSRIESREIDFADCCRGRSSRRETKVSITGMHRYEPLQVNYKLDTVRARALISPGEKRDGLALINEASRRRSLQCCHQHHDSG